MWVICFPGEGRKGVKEDSTFWLEEVEAVVSLRQETRLGAKTREGDGAGGAR